MMTAENTSDIAVANSRYSIIFIASIYIIKFYLNQKGSALCGTLLIIE